ncbi:MAG: DUF3472 domain-containing protein [Mangrovibacterium sp.]
MKKTLSILSVILTLSFLSFTIEKDIPTPTAKAVEIPLGGNSYITNKAGAEKITNAGFTKWNNPKTVFSTYFKLNTSGDLKLYLKYQNTSADNTIEVKCNNKKFKTKLPKVDTENIVYIGTIDKCPKGYVQVDFQGKKLKGEIYADAMSLVVEGTATQDMNFVSDFSFYWGRRGPSVHMGYPIPEGTTAEWFYNEVTVPEGEDAIGSYFMANGFGEGYFGIQVNSPTERRVLFSVWSPFKTDNPKEIPDDHKIILVKKGEKVRTGEFGNEGSGGQSYMVYDWKAGNTYKFLTHIHPAENGYSEYTAYFFAPEVGKWQLIAQFLRPKTNTYYTRPYSFLENFNTETGYVGRKAHYNNQWIYTKEGQWVELINGRFTADNTARNNARLDYKGGVEEAGFFLQNCGFLSDNTEIGTTFERKATNKKPDINWSELE